MATTPLVSVIIPVYNGERYIAEAVNSILNQTYRNLELIVLDNGSTDQTAHILNALAEKDYRLTVLFHPTPLGHAGEAASNLASRQAKGKYIAKLDADDVAFPERISKQVAFLEANPDIFLVGSYLEVINSEGQKIGVRKYPLTHKKIYREFYLRFPVANPAIMYRSGIVKADFYILREKLFTDDYFSLFVYAHRGLQLANISECLTRYRIHSTNTVFTNIREKWKVNWRVKKSFVKEYNYKPPLYHQIVVIFQDIAIRFLPKPLLMFLFTLRNFR
jgi:glycosyltransferase involved in cell wall biosynthesis